MDLFGINIKSYKMRGGYEMDCGNTKLLHSYKLNSKVAGDHFIPETDTFVQTSLEKDKDKIRQQMIKGYMKLLSK